MKPENASFITIVSGLPRSGTSMMMRMLEAGGMPVLTDRVRAADADNPIGYYELEVVKQLSRGTAADTAWLHGARGKAVKVIYRLLYHLPGDRRYKVIYLKRRLEEVVASQKAMVERRRTTGSTLGDPALIEAFDAETRKAERWLKGQENFIMLRLDYRAIIEDPHHGVAEVGRFLDLDLDLDAMAGVIDSGLYRQRV